MYNNSLLLLEKGEVWKMGNLPFQPADKKISNIFSSIPEKLLEFKTHKIDMISCSSASIIHLLTNDGIVFTWGVDLDNLGLLGLGDVISQKTPVIMEELSRNRIKWISCGNKHASAVDVKGSLYMWGSGNQGELGIKEPNKLTKPTRIEAYDSHNYKSSFCKNNFTALITMGGTLYFYGNIGDFFINNENLSQKSNQSPDVFLNAYTFAVFKDHFVRNIFLGDNFAIVLADKGSLFFMSDDFSLKEINKNMLFNSAALLKNKLYAFSDTNELFEWNITFNQITQTKIYKLHYWVKQPMLINTTQNKMIVIIFTHKFLDEIPFLETKLKTSEKDPIKTLSNENNEYVSENLVESTSLFPTKTSKDKKTSNIQANFSKSNKLPHFHNIYQTNETDKSSFLDENSLILNKKTEINFMKFKNMKEYLNRNENPMEINIDALKINNSNNTSSSKTTKNLKKSAIEKNLFKDFLQNDSKIESGEKKREDFRKFIESKRDKIHKKMNEIPMKSKQITNQNESNYTENSVKNKDKTSFSLGNVKNQESNESYMKNPRFEDDFPKFANDNLEKRFLEEQNKRVFSDITANNYQTKPLEYFLNIINCDTNKSKENDIPQEKAIENKQSSSRAKSQLSLDSKKNKFDKKRKNLDFLNNYKENPILTNNSSHSKKASISKIRKQFLRDLDKNFYRNEDINLGASIMLGDTDLNTSRTIKTFEERISTSNRKKKITSMAYKYKNMIENMVVNKKIQNSLLNQSMNKSNNDPEPKISLRTFKDISIKKEDFYDDDVPLNSLYNKLKNDLETAKLGLTDKMFDEYERVLEDEEKLKEIKNEFLDELINNEEEVYNQQNQLEVLNEQEQENHEEIINNTENIRETQNNKSIKSSKISKIQENVDKNQENQEDFVKKQNFLDSVSEINKNQGEIPENSNEKFDSFKNKLLNFWDSKSNNETNESEIKNNKVTKIQKKLLDLKSIINKDNKQAKQPENEKKLSTVKNFIENPNNFSNIMETYNNNGEISKNENKNIEGNYFQKDNYQNFDKNQKTIQNIKDYNQSKNSYDKEDFVNNEIYNKKNQIFMKNIKDNEDNDPSKRNNNDINSINNQVNFGNSDRDFKNQDNKLNIHNNNENDNYINQNPKNISSKNNLFEQKNNEKLNNYNNHQNSNYNSKLNENNIINEEKLIHEIVEQKTIEQRRQNENNLIYNDNEQNPKYNTLLTSPRNAINENNSNFNKNKTLNMTEEHQKNNQNNNQNKINQLKSNDNEFKLVSNKVNSNNITNGTKTQEIENIIYQDPKNLIHNYPYIIENDQTDQDQEQILSKNIENKYFDNQNAKENLKKTHKNAQLKQCNQFSLNLNNLKKNFDSIELEKDLPIGIKEVFHKISPMNSNMKTITFLKNEMNLENNTINENKKDFLSFSPIRPLETHNADDYETFQKEENAKNLNISKKMLFSPILPINCLEKNEEQKQQNFSNVKTSDFQDNEKIIQLNNKQNPAKKENFNNNLQKNTDFENKFDLGIKPIIFKENTENEQIHDKNFYKKEKINNKDHENRENIEIHDNFQTRTEDDSAYKPGNYKEKPDFMEIHSNLKNSDEFENKFNKYNSEIKPKNLNSADNLMFSNKKKLLNSQSKECQTGRSAHEMQEFIEQMKFYQMDIGLIAKPKFPNYEVLSEEEDNKNKILVNKIFERISKNLNPKNCFNSSANVCQTPQIKSNYYESSDLKPLHFSEKVRETGNFLNLDDYQKKEIFNAAEKISNLSTRNNFIDNSNNFQGNVASNMNEILKNSEYFKEINQNIKNMKAESIFERLFPRIEEENHENYENSKISEKNQTNSNNFLMILFVKLEKILMKRVFEIFYFMKENINIEKEKIRNEIKNSFQAINFILKIHEKNSLKKVLTNFKNQTMNVKMMDLGRKFESNNSKIEMMCSSFNKKLKKNLKKCFNRIKIFGEILEKNLEKRKIYRLNLEMLKKKILKKQKNFKMYSFGKIREFSQFKHLKYNNFLHVLHSFFEQKKTSLMIFGFWQMKQLFIAEKIKYDSEYLNLKKSMDKFDIHSLTNFEYKVNSIISGAVNDLKQKNSNGTLPLTTKFGDKQINSKYMTTVLENKLESRDGFSYNLLSDTIL